MLSRSATVGVVGQGYVGVSLACAAADAGFTAVGMDVDRSRVRDLRRGVMTVHSVNEPLFRAGVSSGRVTFTSDLRSLEDSDIVLICVPTPVRDGAPDLSFVERAQRRDPSSAVRTAGRPRVDHVPRHHR